MGGPEGRDTDGRSVTTMIALLGDGFDMHPYKAELKSVLRMSYFHRVEVVVPTGPV